MNATRTLVVALLASALLPLVGAQAQTSATVVKATAKGTKAGGKTTVTITMDIAPKYIIFANPVGHPDLVVAQTTVKFTARGKPVEAKVEYPGGTLQKCHKAGDYSFYKGKVTIRATVSSTEALQASIFLQAYGITRTLLPATIRVKVD
jgi:hypothetical protein